MPQQHGDSRVRRFIDDGWSDLKVARRGLTKSPGFAIVAIVTLGLGIGANSAIFSVVNGVLLEGLPYRDAARLYDLGTVYPDRTTYPLSAPDFMSIRASARTLDRVEAFSMGRFTLLGVGEPQQVRVASVSDGLFDLLGLRMADGRWFLPEEYRPGKGTSVVLDHGFWQRALGGDRSVLGRAYVVGGESATVVGVLAPDVRLPRDADVYTTLEYNETFDAATARGRRSEVLRALAHARPGVSQATIDEDVRRIGATLQTGFPDTNANLTFNARPLGDVIVGDVRTPLLVLLGAVGFVLLVACANVANLLLARASARRAELAVRAALGAGRARLLRQLLTEAVVLGLAGGAVGLAIAYASTRALAAAEAAQIPRIEHVGMNGRVLLFTFVIALFTGLAFGALPALQASGRRLTSALREGGRGEGVGSGHRVRGALVVAEMALAVVLLTGAGLLIRSFVELTRVPLGFAPEHAVAMRVTMQGEAYRTRPQILARVEALLDRLRGLPGVTAVAAATILPMSANTDVLSFSVEGAGPPPPGVNPEIWTDSVTPDYFRAIGARLVRGRGFSAGDTADAPPVVLINEAAIRRWFPDRDPIGRKVRVGAVREIVGVVADVLQADPGRPVQPQLYIPFAQRPTGRARVILRTTGAPLAQVAAMRAQVHALDPDLPITEITPLETLPDRSVARPRFYMSLLALFAGVALALAAIGIFGVISYAVAQRAREIGIRMALGARRHEVVRPIVVRAMGLAAAGLAVGIVIAMALGQTLRGLLFGVSPVDPLTIGAVTLVLGAAAALASYLPARRAASVDPAIVLREG